MQQTSTWYNNRENGPFQNFLEKSWETSPTMSVLTLIHFGMIFVCLLGLALDGRTLMGEPVWIKPLKFAISGGIYCATITWLMAYVTRAKWLGKIIMWGNGFLIFGEVAIITIQAARGLRSHYNVSNPLDGALWGAMGTMIGIMWALNLMLIFLLLFQPFKDAAFKSALVLGVIIAFLGGLTGFYMTGQLTAEQTALQEQGEPLEFAGAHSFGGEDGGAGLPFVGWSTTHGDMRPVHFVGLHGLQMLPLFGLFINRRFAEFTAGRRSFLVLVGAAAYLGVMYALFQQALNGLPITSFDPVTMTILIFVTLAYGTMWNLTVRGGRKQGLNAA